MRITLAVLCLMGTVTAAYLRQPLVALAIAAFGIVLLPRK